MNILYLEDEKKKIFEPFMLYFDDAFKDDDQVEIVNSQTSDNAENLFEGGNFDIIAGITSPVVGFLFIKKVLGNLFLILWNILCLGLVLFIMAIGTLSAEMPFQQFAFDQPNTAMIYFPFILLPAVSGFLF